MKRRDFWWDAEPDQVATAVVKRGQDLEGQYAGRYEHAKRMFNLYRTGSQTAKYSRKSRNMRRNTASEVCDAFVSEVAGQPPTIAITLRDVGWKAREQARLWGWYSDAAYDRQEMPDLHLRCAIDSYCAGAGFVFVVDEADGPRLERVHPCDVLIDDAGCSPQNPPWEWGRRHLIPKHVLVAECEERAKDATGEEKKRLEAVAMQIEQAPGASRSRGYDLIRCYEFWMRDGRHVLAAEGVALAIEDEEWEGDAPVAYLVLKPDEAGLWGISMMDGLATLQAGRNFASKTIQRGLRWHVPRLMATKGTLDDGAVTDDTRTIVEVNGDPSAVRPLEMRAASPEMMSREEYIDSVMFQAGQANEMFANGTRQPGTNSAKQLQLQRDLSTRKNLPMFRRVGAFGVRMFRELARGEVRAKEKHPGHKVVVKRSGVEVDLSAQVLELDVDTLQIRAQPAGALPQEASSRLDLLNEAKRDGNIDQKTWLANSGVVEFEKAQAEEVAIVEMIEQQVDAILYDDEAPVLPAFLPVPYIEQAIKKGTAKYLKARVDMADELDSGSDNRKAQLRARLAELEKWIANAGELIRKKQPPPPAFAAGAPPGGGPGPGLATPPVPGAPPPGGGILPDEGSNVIPMVSP